MAFWDSNDGIVGGFKYLSDPGHIFLDDPKDAQATATASQGAQGVSAQEQAWAQEQWRRQMEGLQYAQGAYAPSNDYARTMAMQGPGAMESYWSQNQNKFGQPGAQQGAYDQYQAWMSDPWNNATRQGANQANYYLAGNTASNDAYYQNRGQLQNYSGPQNAADQYGAYRQAFNSTGTGENYYTQNQQRYNTGGAARDVYDLYSGQLAGPSQSEQFKVDQPTYSRDNLTTNLTWANGQTAGQRNEAENKGYVRNASDINDYYRSQASTLAGPGQYEQFVTADINGYNPAYEREKAQGIAQINQEMARRGSFNSGAALTSIGNYTGALDAADYQNRANRAQQAQQMELARIGQGTQTAGASSANQLAQGQALQGMDNANEAAALGRKQYGLQALQQATNESLQGQQLALQAAGQGDAQMLARLQGLQGMASAGDQSTLAYLKAGQDAAANAQAQNLARLMGGMNSANQVDQTRLAGDQQALARLQASYGMAQGSDAANLARAQQLFAQGQGVDASMMQRYQQQQNASQALDQYNLANLLGGGQMANQAQDAEQQRMKQVFDALFAGNDAQANQYGKFYSEGGELSQQAMTDAMSALMQSYGYDVQGKESAADRQAQKQAVVANLLGSYFGKAPSKTAPSGGKAG